MPPGDLLDDPATFPGLLRRVVIRRPEQQIPARPVVPPVRYRNLLLVVAQRKPRLLGRDRQSRSSIRKQQRHIVLVPPRRPLRQAALGRHRAQKVQPLRRRRRRRPGTTGPARIDEHAAGDRTSSACTTTGTNRPALLCATSTTGWPRGVL